MQGLHHALPAGPQTTLHSALNGNFDSGGNYLPGSVGFNLADVSNVAQLDSVPDGVKGLVWVGQCNGVDTTFLRTVWPFIGNARLFGFYLMDDPDPTGRWRSLCKAENLAAESRLDPRQHPRRQDIRSPHVHDFFQDAFVRRHLQPCQFTH